MRDVIAALVVMLFVVVGVAVVEAIGQQPPQGDPNVALANLGDQLKQKAIDYSVCVSVNDALMKENEKLKKELASLKEKK